VRVISIVIAEDHRVVSQGLRALLEAEHDLRVLAEAADGLEAVAAVERLKPDVLVLDLVLPALHGLEVTRQVARRCPGARVVVLSMYRDEAYVLEALRSGASGYVLKEHDSAHLLRAIREAVEGRRYLSPPLSERAIEAYLEKAAAAPPDPYDALTSREREVLQLIAEGHTNSEAAGRLYLSVRTVETHRANLMRKLGLHSQTEIMRFAAKRGLLPGE
jgi:DNA-binding NarL/FixJ family response regulator